MTTGNAAAGRGQVEGRHGPARAGEGPDGDDGHSVAVLVSGAAAHVAQVADTLRARGAAVTEVADLDKLPDACAAAGPRAFDAYVQLPASFQVRGPTAIHRVHSFYADGVLARFPALAAALPSLATPARVTFVLGQLPPDTATPADREARRALTSVLGHAAQADAPDRDLVVRVLDAGSTADRIASVALGEPAHASGEHVPEMSYSDWRVELLSLSAVET